MGNIKAKVDESMFRTLFETASDMIAIHDLNGNLIDFNDQFANSLGYSRKQLRSMTVMGLAFPERKPIFGKKVTEVIRKGRAIWEGKLRRKDGSPLYCEFHVARRSPHSNELFSIIYNISERREHEQAMRDIMDNLELLVQKRTGELRASNELLEKMFLNTQFLVAFLDKKFNYIRVNKAFANASMQEPEYFVGLNHAVIYPAPEFTKTLKKVLTTGKPFSDYSRPFQYSRTPGRGLTYWDVGIQPVKDEKGKIDGLVLVLVDVTERKMAEDDLAKARFKLIEAKRLADLGTLSTVVAHELRNPLAVIKTALMNIERKSSDDRIRSNLENISRQVDESSRIINNLLQYSKLMQPRSENVDLVRLIDECISSVRNRMKRQGIKVQIDPTRVPVTAFGDRVQLKEVFVNLIANAFQAIIAKGNRYGKVNIRMGHDGKGKMIVSIRDNGEGMTKEILGRIYEPFFTSRAKGIGLGLSLCKEIIELHNGELIHSSRKGIGTKVDVILPAAPR